MADEAVIVIATASHRAILNRRLEARGFDLGAARRGNTYIDLAAENCLAQFMKDGWPDELQFRQTITHVLRQAGSSGRKIRAFGEMVALLWGEGLMGASVRLEHLWIELRREQTFPLYCAYPKSGFTAATEDSLRQICAAHTKVVVNRG